jgi:hypothetical protein
MTWAQNFLEHPVPAITTNLCLNSLRLVLAVHLQVFNKRWHSQQSGRRRFLYSSLLSKLTHRLTPQFYDLYDTNVRRSALYALYHVYEHLAEDAVSGSGIQASYDIALCTTANPHIRPNSVHCE